MDSPTASVAFAWKLTAMITLAAFLLVGSANGAESVHVRGRRIPGRRPTSPPEVVTVIPCYSALSNDTLPAAHIRGSGNEWEPKTPGYTQKWECRSNSTHGSAFVTGGMWFKQNSLHVPLHGWYHISSQVTFQTNTVDQFHKFAHTLKVKRNCSSTLFSTDYSHIARTTVSPAETNATTTTVVSTLVKICQGGKISVSILDTDSDCCPYAGDSSTMITAYLVQEVKDDEWSPTSSNQPVEAFQET